VLKSLEKKFENKKNAIKISEDRTGQIKYILQNFLKEKFGDKLKGISIGISYNSKNNSLVVNTISKVLANEIAVRLSEFNDFLKKNDIRLSKIIVK